MIRLQLTEWEIMVLRAALETHIKNAPTKSLRLQASLLWKEGKRK